METLAKKLLDILYPRRCAVCDRVLAVREQSVCEGCKDRLSYTGEQYCLQCGRPVQEGEEYCPDCEGKKAAYCSGRSLFLYNAAVRESISRFKYHGRQEYAAFYGAEMYREFGGWMEKRKPDALIPVPIHKKRCQKRGFNQAELLAGELGRLSGIPVLTDVLIRVKDTKPQKELSKQERMENLHQAFLVRSAGQELYNKINCVIIIDDIYTTGSTMEMCARALRKEGIREVYFLCISTGRAY